MLETIRQYAVEKLVASEEADLLRRRHAVYFVASAERDFSENGNYSPDWLRRLDRESDNFRAALIWSQTTVGGSELLLRLAVPLTYYVYARGYSHEIQHAVEDALWYAQGLEHTAVSAPACFYLAEIRAMRCDYNAAQPLFERSLMLLHELKDIPKYARALHRRGWLARERGDAVAARSKLEESLALYRDLGDEIGAIDVLTTMGQVAVLQEEPDRAEKLLEESLALARKHNSQFYIGWGLNHLGHVAQLRGDYDQATDFQEQSLVVFRELLGERNMGETWVLQSLGETALAQGNRVGAKLRLTAGVALCRDLGDYLCLAWCLAGLGSVVALDGQPERAAHLWGAAEVLRESIGGRAMPAGRATYERAVTAGRTQLGDAAFAAAWAAGRAMTVEQAIAEALASGD
jgi:tetratricopeptide (TPR) repeat protein